MIWDKIAYIVIHAILNVVMYAFAYYQSIQGHPYWAISTLILSLLGSCSYSARISRWYGKL